MVDFYKQRIAEVEQTIRLEQQKSRKISWLRLLVFLAGLGLSIASFNAFAWQVGLVVSLISLTAFIAAIRWHTKVEEQLQKIEAIRKIYANELEIKSANVFGVGEGYVDDKHAYSSDLDLFGPNSIFARFNRTATKEGSDKLADFLKQKSSLKDIQDRQELAAELMQKERFKEDFLATFFLSRKSLQDQSERVHSFTTQFKPTLMHKPLFGIALKVLPALFIGFFVAGFFWSPAWTILGFIFLAELAVVLAANQQVDKIDGYVGKHAGVFRKYSLLASLIVKEDFQHHELQRIKSSLGGKYKMAEELQRLDSYSQKLEYRGNLFTGVILNCLFLWNVLWAIRIEQWFVSNASKLELSLSEIGLMDAYLSLSVVRFNHPQWVYPTVTDSYFALQAKAVGHPLINKQQRVLNSYSLNGAPAIDIITGSNMAGKSTFLRTLGVNMVLAFAGAPVCATELKVSLCNIMTYMRIRDSLNENASSFYAELLRLKQILTEVERDNRCFLLLDELLRGTNSLDKYQGSVAIIKQLLKLQTVGLVATHDLGLAKLQDEFPENVRNFHFDISVSDEEFSFDYKLHEGVCENSNASLLMKKMGMGDS